MANQAVRRLLLDLRRITADPPEGCHACPKGSDIFTWHGMIFGPTETPFEGGVFEIVLAFDERYPLVPPKCRFTTPVFHPNVYPDGQVCVDILGNRWMPSYGASALLVSLQSLLALPGTHDRTEAAANPEAERLYVTDRHRYDRHVMALVDQQLLQDEAETGEGDDGAVASLVQRSVGLSSADCDLSIGSSSSSSTVEVPLPSLPLAERFPRGRDCPVVQPGTEGKGVSDIMNGGNMVCLPVVPDAAWCHRAPRSFRGRPVPTFGSCFGNSCGC